MMPKYNRPDFGSEDHEVPKDNSPKKKSPKFTHTNKQATDTGKVVVQVVTGAEPAARSSSGLTGGQVAAIFFCLILFSFAAYHLSYKPVGQNLKKHALEKVHKYTEPVDRKKENVDVVVVAPEPLKKPDSQEEEPMLDGGGNPPLPDGDTDVDDLPGDWLSGAPTGNKEGLNLPADFFVRPDGTDLLSLAHSMPTTWEDAERFLKNDPTVDPQQLALLQQAVAKNPKLRDRIALALLEARFGIFPSLKLATFYHESAAGTSKHAKESGNYFGIKSFVPKLKKIGGKLELYLQKSKGKISQEDWEFLQALRFHMQIVVDADDGIKTAEDDGPADPFVKLGGDGDVDPIALSFAMHTVFIYVSGFDLDSMHSSTLSHELRYIRSLLLTTGYDAAIAINNAGYQADHTAWLKLVKHMNKNGFGLLDRFVPLWYRYDCFSAMDGFMIATYGGPNYKGPAFRLEDMKNIGIDVR